MMKNRNRSVRKFLGFLSLSVLLVLAGALFANAATGDFSIDFVAAAPQTYDHSDGGGFYGNIDGDRVIGETVVTSLQSSDFRNWDIVSYLTRISVGGDGSDDPQAVRINYEFTGANTGKRGAGFYEFINCKVNEEDPAMVDPGANSAATEDGWYFEGTLFEKGSMLHVPVIVSGLDSGDTIIVRVDIRVRYESGASPTGNLQAQLSSMELVEFVESYQSSVEDYVSLGKIPTGNQTVPFKIDDFVVPLGINIVKTGSFNDEDGDGFADVGETIGYEFAVTNSGDIELADVTVTDALLNGQGINIAYVSGDENLNDLLDLDETWIFTANQGYVIDQTEIDAGKVDNEATAKGFDLFDPSRYVESSNPETVLLPQNPSVLIDKKTMGWNDAYVQDNAVAITGDEVGWSYEVTNNGNVTLYNVAIVDEDLGDAPEYVIYTVPKLDVDQSYTHYETGIAVEGPYNNLGETYGYKTDTDEYPTTADAVYQDSSSYTGYSPKIYVGRQVNSAADYVFYFDNPSGNELNPYNDYTIVVKNKSSALIPALHVTVNANGFELYNSTLATDAQWSSATIVGTDVITVEAYVEGFEDLNFSKVLE